MRSSGTCGTSRRKPARAESSDSGGLQRPQYRLRVDEIRVFYDVTASTGEILAIIEKREAQAWLTQSGTPGPNGGAGESEG
jgi:mRNA interferase RelE/StbE